jgi:predicted component of type VI protein secretion system
MPRPTYTIGRSPSADIRTPASDRSVSSVHAEITIAKDRRLYLTDRNSTNGTEVFRDGRWQPLRQDFVGLEERVRLGSYETTLHSLVSSIPDERPKPEPEPSLAASAVMPAVVDPPLRPRRNPETGEVIEG